MTLQHWQDVAGYLKREFRSFVGLIVAMGTALSQANLPPPWPQRVSWICIAGGAAYVYMSKPFQSREAWGAGVPPDDPTKETP
jgi:hypothetical protein